MQASVYVGDRVRRLRNELALTQAELAEEVGITITALSRIERNEAQPRPKTRRRLAEALGVEPRVLLAED
jgi:XRE family transcriptional regulator, fatty acid utilization regulator